MGIIQRLFGKKGKKQLQGTLAMPINLINGQLITTDNSRTSNIRDSYEQVSAVYSIVDIITEKISTIPWILCKTPEAKKKELKRIKNYSPQANVRKLRLLKNLDEVESHPFLDLWEHPNEFQSKSEFIKQFFGYRLITGNSFIRINAGQPPGTPIGTGIKPVELEIQPAHIMEVISPTNSMWAIVGYQIKTGIFVKYDVSEIIHWRYPNYDFDPVTKSHLYGMSPLKAGANDILALKYNKRAQASQSQNEGAKGLLVRNDDIELTEEQRDLIQDRADQEINNYRNKGRAIVTNANIRWEQLGLSAGDMKLVEMGQIQKEDICNLYNFPPHLLLTSGSTFNNVDSAIKYLTTNTCMSELVDFRDMINVFIERFYGPGLWFDFDITEMPELLSDYKLMADIISVLDVISPNEKRMMLNYDELPDENMDKIYIKSGVTPIDKLNQEDPMEQEVQRLRQSGGDDYGQR